MTHTNRGNELEQKIMGNIGEKPPINKETLAFMQKAFDARGKIKKLTTEESWEDFQNRMKNDAKEILEIEDVKESLIKEIIKSAKLPSCLDEGCEKTKATAENFYDKLYDLQPDILQRIKTHIKEIDGACQRLAKASTFAISHLYYNFTDEEIALSLQTDDKFKEKTSNLYYEPYNKSFNGEADGSSGN